MEKIDLWQYEKELNKQGINIIGGTDEAGRGPLFGPVVAACVVLPKNFELKGLNDSKKLTEKKRNELYNYIIENTIYGIGIVDAKEIDKINIYEASRKAMVIAIKKVQKQIPLEYVLSDAMPIDMLYEIDKKYPEYGFKNHKGYPTKKHLEAINKYGLIEGYRKTYGPVKNYIENGIVRKE